LQHIAPTEGTAMTTTSSTWTTQAACAGRADLFQSPTLDYDPAEAAACQSCGQPIRTSADGQPVHATATADCPAGATPTLSPYATLTTTEQAALAADKHATEQAALAVCAGCPVLAQCKQWATSNPTHGVAGGHTSTELAALRATSGHDDHAQQAMVASLCGDRGPRNQIDDHTVARLTAQGRDAASIARDLDCSSRTVVRARARLKRTPQPMSTDVDTTPPATAPAGHTTGTPSSPIPGMRQVSPAMQAIFSSLADGQWHTRDTLLTLALPLVPDSEALDWAGRERRKKNNATTVSRTEQIHAGARGKILNSLYASAQRGRLERGGPDGTRPDLYRLPAAAAHAA
jgi:hypothetical protein